MVCIDEFLRRLRGRVPRRKIRAASKKEARPNVARLSMHAGLTGRGENGLAANGEHYGTTSETKRTRPTAV